MIRSILVLVFMLFAFNAQAVTPFHPYEEERFSAIEAEIDGIDAEVLTQSIKSKKFNIKPTAAAYATGSTITLGTLPANAVIYKDFIYVQTALVSAATDSTLAVQCESAADLLAATTFANGSTYASGTLVNGARNFTNTATASVVETGSNGCNVQAVVGSPGAAFSAGELELTVEYILY